MASFVRRVVLSLRLPAGLIALAGLLLSSLVQAASIRGVDVESVWPGVWLVHYALYPVIALAVLTAVFVAGQTRLGFRAFLGLIPVPALILLVAVFVYVIATFLMFTPLSGAGDPMVQNGRFFFNNHGVIREVSESEYHFRRSASLRLFSSVWLYLYLFAVVYLLGARQSPNERHSQAAAPAEGSKTRS